jgi:hypothetical protein
MRRSLFALTLIGLTAAVALAAPAAEAQHKPAPTRQCFSSHDWNGWKASPDSKSIYIRVGVSKIYRLDLSQACPALQGIGVHLVTRIHGSPWICHPLDLDLKVSDGHGFVTPCIVDDIVPLSEAEAKALPKDVRP